MLVRYMSKINAPLVLYGNEDRGNVIVSLKETYPGMAKFLVEEEFGDSYTCYLVPTQVDNLNCIMLLDIELKLISVENGRCRLGCDGDSHCYRIPPPGLRPVRESIGNGEYLLGE